MQGHDQRRQRYQLVFKNTIIFLYTNTQFLLLAEVLKTSEGESDVTCYMNVPTSNIKPTFQLSLVFQEIVGTLLASSPLNYGLLASCKESDVNLRKKETEQTSLMIPNTSRQGPKPVWINTWSLSDIQDNDKFLNILKEATNAGQKIHGKTVYIVSRMYRSEYLDFASKMDWIHVTETSEIICQNSNLCLVLVGFPANLKKLPGGICQYPATTTKSHESNSA